MGQRSKLFIVWGVVVIVFAALFTAIIPVIATNLVTSPTPVGQSSLIFVETVVRVVAAVLPPIGAALLVAGLVLRPRRVADDERSESNERSESLRQS